MRLSKLLLSIIGIASIGLFATTAFAVQVSVPSAPSSSYGLISTTTGNYIATTTGVVACSSGATCSSGSYVFGNALSVTVSGLTTANFSSANISQWTNNSNYITLTSLSGVAPITYNSSTGAIGTSFSTSSTNIFTGSNTFNTQTNFLGPLVIGTSTASTTIWGNTATSTFASGINLTNGGCLAYAGVCLTAGLLNGGSTEAVNWATTAVLSGTPTYSNGTAGVGSTLTEIGTGALSVDSNSPAAGDRVLVKNQASAFQNGIYVVTATGSGIASYILTRASDYNSPTEITPGITTYVLTGTTNTDTSWAVLYTPPLTIGTNNLTYTQIQAGSVGSAITFNNSGSGASSGQTYNGSAAVTISNNTIGAVPTTRNVNTTFPLQGGGALSGDLTLISAFSTTTNSGMAQGFQYVGSGGIFQTAGSSSLFGFIPLATADPFTHPQTNTSASSTNFIFNNGLTGSTTFSGGVTIFNATTTNATTTALAITGLGGVAGPLYVNTSGNVALAGSGTSGNCVKWLASNTLGDAGAACGTGNGGSYPFTPSTFGSGVPVSATSSTIQAAGGIFGTSTIGAVVASSSITNQSVKSALVLNSATGLEGAYGGATNPCGFQSAPTTLSAVGVLGGCVGPFVGTTTNSGLGANLIIYTNSGGNFIGTASSTLFGTATPGQVWGFTNGAWAAISTSSGGVSGGTAGMLAAFTSATALTATGTPTAAAYFATSTTATSTFLGTVQIGTSTSVSIGAASNPSFVNIALPFGLPTMEALTITGSTTGIGGFQEGNIQNQNPNGQSGWTATADNGTITTNFVGLYENSSLFNTAASSNVGFGGDASLLKLGGNLYVMDGTAGKSLYLGAGGVATSSIQETLAPIGNAFGTTTPLLGELTLGTSTAGVPQLTLSANTAGIPSLTFSNRGGNFYLGTTTALGTATSTQQAALAILGTGNPSLNIGSTTCYGGSPTNCTNITFNNGTVVLGTNGANGTTTVFAGRLQFDMYNAAGTHSCMFVVGTAVTVLAGACNQ